jgi:hypothetical protein
MSPIAVESNGALADVHPGKEVLLPPKAAQERLRKAGIDFESEFRCVDIQLTSEGYPYYPAKPKYVQDVEKLRVELRNGRDYIDPATRADKSKKSLFSAAKEVRDLNVNIGVRQTQAQS